MTSKMLLEQYMAERHALGFSLKTDEGCIRRFLQDFAEPDDGEISFTKEYVLDQTEPANQYHPQRCQRNQWISRFCDPQRLYSI